MRKLMTLVGCLGALSGTIQAQDSTATQALNEAQITVSRLDVKAKNLGRDIEIITAKQWSDWPVSTLDEVLRLAAGVETQQRGLFGNQTDITIWGSTFNQVLILLDGNRINDPLTGHFNGYIPVALAEVSRIEIIKGASSGIYGSEAVGGVINIVTKAFDADADENQAEVQLGAGDFGLQTIQAGGQFAAEKFAVSGGVDHQKADGHLAEGDSIPYGFENTRYSVSASGKIGAKVQIALGSSFDTRDFGARYFYTRSTFDLSEEKVTRQFNRGRIIISENDAHKTTISGGFQKSTDYFLFNPLFPANEHETSHSELNVYHQVRVSDLLQVTVGGHYLDQQVVSSDRGNHNYSNVAGYALAHKGFGPSLRVSLGLRVDNNGSNTAITPQLSSVWFASDKLSVRLAAGKANRAADVTERYVSTNLTGPLSDGRNLGNPGLANEQSSNFELGGEYRVGQGMIKATAFARQSTDLIDYVLTPSDQIEAENILDSANYFFAQNIDELTTYGLDVSVFQQFVVNDELSANVQVGYMALGFDRPTDEISKYIANSAKNLFKANLGVNWKKACLTINGLCKQRQFDEAQQINRELSESYFVADARLSFEVWPGHGSLFASCYNVLDHDYSDILGATLPGRWISGGVKLRL